MSRRTTGGCQCGAVRYGFDRPASGAHLCNCRMCQKASGNYFLPLADVATDDFQVTRGAIAYFASSDFVKRGFCRDCGTPLSFEAVDGSYCSIVLGSLDDPAAVRPSEQHGVEGRLPWFADLAGLPIDRNDDAVGDDVVQLQRIAATSRQHPDHDTDKGGVAWELER